MTIDQLSELVGGLSRPSKMPCHGYSIPARTCITGSKLREVAGSVCEGCYAMKGRYGFANVQTAMDRRLKAIRHPLWVDHMVELIDRSEKSGYFRWHDSGDLQGEWHLVKIIQIAERLLHIKFWLPTREYQIVRNVFDLGWKIPENLTIRLSAHMVDGPMPVKLALAVGAAASGVVSEGQSCPSEYQDNKCLNCRACWDKTKTTVTYKYH